MRILIKICLLMLLFVGESQATDFIEGIDDVPLMSGLKQIHSSNIAFGNSESRFNEVYLSANKMNYGKVENFYRNTLPQLGWKFVGSEEKALHFERDMEVLDIAVEKKSPLLVRITLKSKD